MAGLMRLLLLALLAISASAQAQQADPTRPPASWLAPAEEAHGAGDSGGGMRLQSVLMSQGRHPVAVIGGKTVVLGGKIGGATLVRLNEKEAVLQGPDGVTHLYMAPDVDKQMIVTPHARQRARPDSMKGLP